jgi:O-antigen ligase
MSLFWKPERYKPHGFATPWNGCTIHHVSLGDILPPLLAASAATLTIWIRDPLAEWSYEIAVFGIAAAACLRRRTTPWSAAGVAMAVIAVWGFIQLALGATAYRYATMNAALRFAALAATACMAPRGRSRAIFLQALAWFGCSMAVLAVLAHYTSSGKVLWIFPSPFQDIWGPFLNRNNFAAFLELALPVALWLAITRDRSYAWMAAAMLAAGMASASRAGSVLLAAESVAVFAIRPDARKAMASFGVAAVLLIAIAGVGHLTSRIFEPDPLRYRREMARSAVAMIRERPWTGFGLGTFATVYPQYASFDAGAMVDHAHNDWLEWASEGGIGFAAAWAVLAAAMLRRVRRSVWSIGVPAVMIHALVDYPFARFGVSAWTFLLIGMRELDREPH